MPASTPATKTPSIPHVLTGASSFAVSTATGSSAANNNHSNTDGSVHRPNEAQLRWAQFHHKRRAQDVKAHVARLWNTPTSVQDVPGALPEDGATTTEESDATATLTSGKNNRLLQRTADKPKVSRGRRAMLRVSKRVYRRRREEIEKFGFQNVTLTGNSKDDDDEDDENDRLLECIFTAEANPRKRAHRRRRRQHRDATNTNRNPQDEEERLKRFEAACQAMMFNLAGPAPLAIPIPTKRWTRTLDPDAHLEQEYEDLKWGIRKKPAGGGGTMMGMGVGTSMRHLMMPLDRGASWMMHLSTKVVGASSSSFSTRESPYASLALQQQISNISDPLSIYSNPSTLVMRAPGRQKFNQLVALVQQQMIQRGTAGSNQKPLPRPVNAPKMRLTYLTTTAASDDLHNKNLHKDKESNHKYDREENSLPATDGEKDEYCEDNDTRLPPTPRRRPAHPIVDQFRRESEEHEHNDMTRPNPPRRKVHPMADRFLGGEEEDDEHKDNNMALRNPPRRKAHPMSDRFLGEDDEKQYEDNNDTTLPNQPRRKAHPMSDRFHGDSKTQGYEHMPKRMVGKLAISPSAPPNEPSPVGSTSNESDFFAQVRCGGESQPSPAESDLFAQVRPGEKNNSRRLSTGEAEHKPRNLASDESGVFDQVWQGEHNKRNSSIESDFFAQVRQMNPNETMLPNEHLGLIGNERRSSQGDDEDFHGEESTRAARHSSMSSTYSNGSQVNAPGNNVESDHNNAAHTRKSLPKQQQESPSSHVQQESPKSETSALSGLWNRGRSNLGQVVSSALNAIPEQTAKHLPRMSATSTKPSTPTRSSSPVNLKTRASNVSDKVGGFFNMLRGENGKETKGQNVEDEDGDSHVALGAFRKSQEARRESRESMGKHHGDSSSVSSFRVLPAGIRSVIQSMSGGASETKAHDSPSPHRSIATRSSVGTRSSFGDLSPDEFKRFHDKVVKNSPLLGDRDQEQPIIDTDNTESGASDDQMAGRDFHSALSTLMMSPDLLTKRLQQAIRAIEDRNWDQVSYLIMANPWLAEMPETTTKQYLLHKLAFYGTDDAPSDLNQTLLKMFPAAVHKFDRDGNVPLHLAAAAENLEMIELLGEAFSSGASIRNEDGMLPLHFTIASHSGYDPAHDNADDDDLPSPIQVIKTVLKLFPKAVAIPDNDGNLPLHVAVSSLDGPIGVDVVYLLLDEADRQLQDPYGARFYNKVKMEDLENDTVSTVSTEHETDDSSSAIGAGGVVHCNMVRNEKGETPLLTAIRTKNGWEMIEAVACGMGGKKAALTPDMAGNNALHLLVSEEYYWDAAATLSILKVAPEAASMRNGRGVLPIEDACMHGLPREVILAIALVDLPIDLDDKDGVKVREGYGGSWWFLTCDCDDQYVDIVQEVASFCTAQQIRELCFLKVTTGSGTVLSRATPKCQLALTQALRFVGRFEFVGKAALYTDSSSGMKEFDALDFGGTSRGGRLMPDEGRRVLLRCYAFEEPFMKEAANLCDLDTTYVEEVLAFAVNEFSGQPTENEGASSAQQFCISIERPSLTLDRVVAGMLRNDAYSRDPELRRRYAGKIFAVLRLIAKSIRHLHVSGVVHGDLCMEQCGKYEDTWKAMGRLGFQRIGEPFDVNRWHQSYPPEAIGDKTEQEGDSVFNSDDAPVCFNNDLVAAPSLDIWAFGKLAYEALVGDPLFEFDSTKEPSDDFVTMLDIMEWNAEDSLKKVFVRLLDTGITEAAADLITTCLFPRPEERPDSMDDVLAHPAWKEMRRHKDRSSGKHREDVSSIGLSSNRSSL